MDPNIVRPVDTDENYDKDGSEVVPAGHEECKNNEARVSQKCSGKRRKMKALAELESDDSEWITIFPFNGMQKLVYSCLPLFWFNYTYYATLILIFQSFS